MCYSNKKFKANIKILVTIETRRTYLVSEPNYRTTKFFAEHLLAIEMKKTQMLINKPVHLALSILELKILIYEFWYDYIKSKYGEKAKLCYIDTDRFIEYIKEMIFIKKSEKTLKLDLILQIMNYIDHCLKEKIKK